MSVRQKFSHYYRECPFDGIDIYRILKLFDVTDPCLQHAAKKLLVAGSRGAKTRRKDIEEVIASCTRYIEMLEEENQQREECSKDSMIPVEVTHGPDGIHVITDFTRDEFDFVKMIGIYGRIASTRTPQSLFTRGIAKEHQFQDGIWTILTPAGVEAYQRLTGAAPDVNFPKP
jgi:hypothetical protein